MLRKIRDLLDRVDLELFGIKFNVIVERDKKYAIHEEKVAKGLFCDFNYFTKTGRIYIQIEYIAPCTKTKEIQSWRGRKWYLSSYMTDDEVIKTCYTAFESAVKHEVMEGFKVDNIILFNPHVNFEELLKISTKEIKRETL